MDFLIDEDPMLNDQHQYRYMTVDDMKSLGDDSLKIDVTRDEKTDLPNDSVGNYTFIYFLIENNIFGQILKIFFSKFDIKWNSLKIILK